MRLRAILLGMMTTMIAAQEPDQNIFEGQISLTVPGNRTLDTIQFGVDFDELQAIELSEDQGSEEPDDVIQIGSKNVLTLKMNYKKKVRYRNTKMTSSEAVFYLFENADELKSVTITPRYYTKGLEFNEHGKTEPVFQIEVMEVGRVGDAEGRIMKSIDNLSFEIGKPNEVMLNVNVNSGRRVALRLFAMETEEPHVIHLPVRRQGSFLALYEDGIGEEPRKVFNAPVSLRYEQKNLKARQQRMRAFQMVADEINNYVRNSAYYGTPKVVEIPLKIRMRLTPEGMQAQKIIIGPPPAPEEEGAEESQPRRRGILGF